MLTVAAQFLPTCAILRKTIWPPQGGLRFVFMQVWQHL